MGKLVHAVQVLVILFAAVVLNQMGFFKNANWPVVFYAAIVSGTFLFFSLSATIRTINAK